MNNLKDESTRAPTKKAVVTAGLRLLVQTHSQTAIRKLRGKVKWKGNLDNSRAGRSRRSRSPLC